MEPDFIPVECPGSHPLNLYSQSPSLLSALEFSGMFSVPFTGGHEEHFWVRAGERDGFLHLFMTYLLSPSLSQLLPHPMDCLYVSTHLDRDRQTRLGANFRAPDFSPGQEHGQMEYGDAEKPLP